MCTALAEDLNWGPPLSPGSLQAPATPAPEHLMPSSGLHRLLHSHTHIFMHSNVYMHTIKNNRWGWRNAPVVKRVHCSYSGATRPPGTLDSEDPTSSGLCRHLHSSVYNPDLHTGSLTHTRFKGKGRRSWAWWQNPRTWWESKAGG